MPVTTKVTECPNLQSAEDIFNYLQSELTCFIDGKIVLTEGIIRELADNLYRALNNDDQIESQTATDYYKEKM